MSLKITKKEVVEMFQKLGFKAADGWDDEKLTKKVENITKTLEDTEIPEKMTDDADSTVNKLIAAVENKDKIVFIEGEAKSNKKDKKDKDGKKDKKEKKEKKMSRIEAAVKATKAVKKKSTKDEIADASDKIYADAGGAANAKEAKWASRIVIDVMTALEMVEVDGQEVRPAKKEE